jgi:hypothetical protein
MGWDKIPGKYQVMKRRVNQANGRGCSGAGHATGAPHL